MDAFQYQILLYGCKTNRSEKAAGNARRHKKDAIAITKLNFQSRTNYLVVRYVFVGFEIISMN